MSIPEDSPQMRDIASEVKAMERAYEALKPIDQPIQLYRGLANHPKYDMSAYEGFIIKVKGDGKNYYLSFRQTKYFTGFNFTQRFQTEKDKWQFS